MQPVVQLKSGLVRIRQKNARLNHMVTVPLRFMDLEYGMIYHQTSVISNHTINSKRVLKHICSVHYNQLLVKQHPVRVNN